MPEIRLPFYVRFSLLLLSASLGIILLALGKGIFVPLAFSLLLAFLLYPSAKWLEMRVGMSKGVAAFLAVSGFTVIVACLLYFITFQVLQFSQDIPLLQQKITSWIDGTQDWVIRKYHIEDTKQLEYLHQVTNNVLNYAATSLGSLFIGVAEFIFWMVLVFIYTYFILYHRKMLLHFIMRLFSRHHQDKVGNIVVDTRRVTYYYLKGLLIEFVVVAAANTLMFFAIGVKYAILLGVFTALLNIIPYLGIIIGCVLTLLVSLTHGTPLLAFEAVSLLFILHVLDANILLPRVIGISLKLNSLVTIVSVLVGSVIWDISGMFLAIPLCATLKVIFDHIESLEPLGMVMGTEDRSPDQNEKI